MSNYALEDYIDLLVGGKFIKSRRISNNSVELTYFNTYGEFVLQRPKTNISEEMFDNYFETGNKIEKILITEPIRLLRQFHHLDRVGISLRGNRFIADRKKLNEALKIKIEELSTEDGSWVEFVNSFTYNPRNRPYLFNEIQNFSEGIIELCQNQGVTIDEQMDWINSKLSTDNILLGLDGTYQYVERELTKEEKTQNKLIIYFFQGALSALGNRVMNTVLDSNTAQVIRDVVAGWFK